MSKLFYLRRFNCSDSRAWCSVIDADRLRGLIFSRGKHSAAAINAMTDKELMNALNSMFTDAQGNDWSVFSTLKKLQAQSIHCKRLSYI